MTNEINQVYLSDGNDIYIQADHDDNHAYCLLATAKTKEQASVIAKSLNQSFSRVLDKMLFRESIQKMMEPRRETA